MQYCSKLNYKSQKLTQYTFIFLSNINRLNQQTTIMTILDIFPTDFQANYPMSMNILKIIGLIVVLKKIIKFLQSIYKTFLRKRRNFSKRYGKGSWAFITGSSQGIGKAFALSLAKQGFNIILCARTLKKLQIAKQQIQNKYPETEVEILSIDFKRSLQEGYLNGFFGKVQNLDISILVNNVGVDVLDFYHDLPQQQIEDLIKINCAPVAILNRLFIPKFLERTKKLNKKCAIINVSSMAAQIPMALHNVYSASKVFVDFLSRSLSYEYRSLDIISLKPSQVSTPMTSNKPTDILTITAQKCSQGLLDDLGYEYASNGNIGHKLQSAFYAMNPEWFFNYLWFNFVGPSFIQERRMVQQQKQKKNN